MTEEVYDIPALRELCNAVPGSRFINNPEDVCCVAVNGGRNVVKSIRCNGYDLWFGYDNYVKPGVSFSKAVEYLNGGAA